MKKFSQKSKQMFAFSEHMCYTVVVTIEIRRFFYETLE